MHTEHPSNPDVTYEKTDAHPRPLYQFLFWIAVTCVVSAVFSWGVLVGLTKWRASGPERAVMAPAQDTSEPPSPRLQTRESMDLAAFKKEEKEILSTYGVVDKEQGLFRIPIEEAMKLTVERGLPVRGEVPPPPAPGTKVAAPAKPAGKAVRKMTRPITAAFLLLAAQASFAQQAGFTRPSGPVQPASERLKKEVGYEPKLGDRLPLDVQVTDESGAVVPVASFFPGARPVLVVFYYQSCAMLCSLQLESVVASLKGTKYITGRDFTFLAISMDPNDTVEGSQKAKRKTTNAYGQAGSEGGFHFVTGSVESIKRLTSAAGYRYYWDDETKQWAHPSGVLLLAPDGRMARFLPGIEPFPRDLQLALLEASEGKIGTIVDRAILYCYQYNEASGRYGAAIMRTIRLTALLTMTALALFVGLNLRRERKAALSQASL